jgi:hypothetical protein
MNDLTILAGTNQREHVSDEPGYGCGYAWNSLRVDGNGGGDGLRHIRWRGDGFGYPRAFDCEFDRELDEGANGNGDGCGAFVDLVSWQQGMTNYGFLDGNGESRP